MTDEKQKKPKFSYYFYNPITYFGALLAFFILGCEILLFGLDFASGNPNVYLGIITYIILPPFLILGLILIPVGARWKRRRVLRGRLDAKPAILTIDPSKATHRNAFLVFLVGTTIFLIMTMIGSYKAFHYTESVEFCGTTCHQIMGPEFTTYKHSPHAKVSCVECHIGDGAGWYVHYKVAGTRMLAKTFDKSYARPIPVPVENLRPAMDTCEQCHWPGKSFGAVEFKRTYFSGESSPAPKWTIRMLMRVGGQGDSDEGIHAHMYNNNDIYYVADDDKRQKISWVKSVSKSGEESIYTTKDSPYKETAPPAEKIRKMDCMDCHNRPAHNFEAPMPLINRAMAENKINPQIPSIKSKAVDALSKTYASKEEAVAKIRKDLMSYYSEKQTDYYAAHKKEVDEAIEFVVLMYENNFFPEMNSRWEAFPDNSSHMISNGCFRCHDDEHVTKQGAVVSRDCNICHTIIEQGMPGVLEKNSDGL
jgi:hypothetical protein